MEIKNWPKETLDKLCRDRTLCAPHQLDEVTETMLSLAKERLLDTTAIKEPDPLQFLSLSELNLFNFFKDPSLVYNPHVDDHYQRSLVHLSAYKQLSIDKKLIVDVVLEECNKSKTFSTVSNYSFTRINHINQLSHHILYFVENCLDIQRNMFVAELYKSKKLQPFSYEQILWSIENKRRQKPGEKIFVFMYNEWINYLNAIYTDKQKIKKDLNGACIVATNKVYFNYGSKWRNLGDDISSYSAAIIAESEISWNAIAGYAHASTKVPRRLDSFFTMYYRPVFKIL